MTDDGGMYINWSGGGDDNYNGGRNGIPQNWNAGFHYSDKFNNEKNSFNSGYKYSKVIAPGVTKTFSQTFLPNTDPWSSNSTSDNRTSTNKHAVNMTMEFNLDSNNSLKWTSRFNNNQALPKLIIHLKHWMNKESLLIILQEKVKPTPIKTMSHLLSFGDISSKN